MHDGGNSVNVRADGDLHAGQVAGRDITNTKKKTIRIGLAGLAALVVIGGGTATIVTVTEGDSSTTTVYQEGMSPADVGVAGTDEGAVQTALIFLQAAVVGDAGTACQLVSTETRATRFALVGCEQVVFDYADRVAGPGSSERFANAVAGAQTTVRMRGSATAEVVVRPEGLDSVMVRTVREDDRWRVSDTSIAALRM